MAGPGCYIPRYVEASFKGVSFDAMEITSEHGRRGAIGEFPFGESTGYIDLGRRIRKYSLRGRYPNNDHLRSADALIAACESSGPGLLLHPSRGAITAACTACKVTDNPLEAQGVTYIDLSFVEAGGVGSGFSLSDASLYGLSIDTLLNEALIHFKTVYLPEEARWYRRHEVRNVTSNVIEGVRKSYLEALPNGITGNALTVLSEFDVILADTSQIENWEKVRDAIQGGLLATDQYAENFSKAYTAFRSVANVAAGPVTAGDEIILAQNATYSLARISAAAYMTKETLANEAINISEAFMQYNQITILLDEETEYARQLCDERLYIELRRFGSDARTRLLERAYGLPAIVEYDFGTGVHSVVAAWELYQDATRYRELELQNMQHLPNNMGPYITAIRGS